ncbi:MAG TPA: hypothetical protein ENI39_06790 [Anaerolineae bacterium]|nr:hypothetical protein [Anaerolineae bacterium]
MKHQATFKPSPAKRPLHQRLTPLAWALIGVAALVLVLAGVAAVMALGGRSSEEPWEPTSAVITYPTVTSALPTATATVWYGEMITPAVEPTAAHPAWWSDRMTQDENGNWWPPDEVAEMVREAYNASNEAYRIHLIETKPPDYDGYEQAVYDWLSGTRLDGNLMRIDEFREGACPVAYLDWETCVLQVQDWSEDGLECTLGITCQNGTYSEYDPATGELLGQEHRDSYGGVVLIRMRYDPRDGHWKQHDFLRILQ